jgi:hypothetical protein
MPSNTPTRFVWTEDGKCHVTKLSPKTGKPRTLEVVPAPTKEQVQQWRGGRLIQHAMPDLSSDMREFIISGYTPEEFAELFPEG